MKKNKLNNLIAGLFVVLFYIAVFLYAIIFNNATGWSLFFFLTLLLLFDVLTLIPALKNVQLHSIGNTFYEVGQQHTLELEVFRYRPALLLIPLLLIVFKQPPSTRKQSLAFYSGQPKKLVFEWEPLQRGIFEELPFILTSYDLFLTFSKQSELVVTGPFVVLPRLQTSLAEQLYQQLLKADPALSNAFGYQTFSIRNFREYQIGDSLNLVDWKQSGKRNEWIVKEYDYEVKNELQLLFCGLPHKNFEALLSVYYSFVLLLEHKLDFRQTILADYPSTTLKEHLLAAVTPLSTEPILPAFTHKKLVVFVPSRTSCLEEQLRDLKRNNDLFLITFNADELCLYWKNQRYTLDKGGLLLER